jgi:hypothetical protein
MITMLATELFGFTGVFRTWSEAVRFSGSVILAHVGGKYLKKEKIAANQGWPDE